MSRYELHHGDSLDVLAGLDADSVDAIVQDPPAGIGFMGRAWDSHSRYEPRTERGQAIAGALELLGLEPWERGFVTFMAEVLAAELRVCKPGAHSLTWALPRTADLTTLALRLAGWEVRDVITHLFGQGFPKSHDVSKALDKMAGAEREVTRDGATKPSEFSGRFDGRCSSTRERRDAPATEAAKQWAGWGTALSPGHEQWILARRPLDGISPPRLREASGLDYVWSAKTTDARKAAKSWPEYVERMRSDTAEHERAVLAWDADVYAAKMAFSAVDASDEGAVALARDRLDRLAAAKPTAPEWTEHTARSLIPGQPSRVELRRDGEVVAVRERPYSAAPIRTVDANAIAHGTGAINVDGCRTPTSASDAAAMERCNSPGSSQHKTRRPMSAAESPYEDAGRRPLDTTAGRWPKNALLSCSLACEGDDHTPWCPVAELDRQSGHSVTPSSVTRGAGGGNGAYGHIGAQGKVSCPGDSGGASRFFPRFGYYPKASDRKVPGRPDLTNKHPTHKHPRLMSWLVRLITPPGGTVLDPFMGSGTTGVAALSEGARFIGIEREREHYEVAEARIAHAAEHGDVSPKRKPKRAGAAPRDAASTTAQAPEQSSLFQVEPCPAE